jgi:hypothetical protein
MLDLFDNILIRKEEYYAYESEIYTMKKSELGI